MKTVSIVIPTFEEDGILGELDRLTAHLRTIESCQFEVILVDDSAEKYRAPIREHIRASEARLGPRISIRLIEGPSHGKGSAVKVGALASVGDVVFTMDADLPVPLEHIEGFLEHLERAKADVVIAERPFVRNAHSAVRFVLSRGLFLIQRGFIFHSTRFYDTQCGFKAFRGDVLRAMAQRQIVHGGMYDIEYLYVAWLEGKRIETVPVVPRKEARQSKIRIWRCLVTDPVDLVRVKVHGVVGAYGG